MLSQVQFGVVKRPDGSYLGKLNIPHRQVAHWLNFLTVPRRRIQIISVQNRRGGLIVYFQAAKSIYVYLEDHLGEPPRLASAETVQVTIHNGSAPRH